MDHTLKLGRVVHYQHGEGCRAATVVWVQGGKLVNLHVSSSQGSGIKEEPLHYGRTNVTHGTDPGQWHWPDECPNGL